MQNSRKAVLLSLLLFSPAAKAHAANPVLPGPQLLCHRTANEDVPENTLESLET
jgi:glycerophosphoryl diester phosphodiesterase